MIRVKFNDRSQKYDATFQQNGNVVTLLGNIPKDTSGFYIYTTKNVLIGTYEDYKTIYRELDNGIQFSNDGSIWVEPKRDIVISAIWSDSDDAEGLRPDEVSVVVNNESYTLFAEYDWKHTFYEVPESVDYFIASADDVDGYTKTINQHDVTYYHEYLDPTPTLEERVNDLEIAVCELSDVIG